jgi:hypothetical protein
MVRTFNIANCCPAIPHARAQVTSCAPNGAGSAAECVDTASSVNSTANGVRVGPAGRSSHVGPPARFHVTSLPHASGAASTAAAFDTPAAPWPVCLSGFDDYSSPIVVAPLCRANIDSQSPSQPAASQAPANSTRAPQDEPTAPAFSLKCGSAGACRYAGARRVAAGKPRPDKARMQSLCAVRLLHSAMGAQMVLLAPYASPAQRPAQVAVSCVCGNRPSNFCLH